MVTNKVSREEKSCSSFEELGKIWGLKPVIKQTKNKEKLEKQRESFSDRHLCRVCKTPMTYIKDSNIMCCQNPDCKGILREIKNVETGETYAKYEVPFHTLDNRGSEIATNIFAELN
ncbi:hypothetical protein [Clostridium sp.]|uniref:hypothetical protein n=1 Tax=Clostridium sp. TaxID=1506 RepID=UPI003217B62D